MNPNSKPSGRFVKKSIVFCTLLIVIIVSGSFLLSKSNNKSSSLFKKHNVKTASESGKIKDKTLPVTSDLIMENIVEAHISRNQASITWNTSLASSGQIEYGTTAEYGNTTPIENTPGTSHKIDLTNLLPNTLYHYHVVSASETSSALSEDFSFTTAGDQRVDPLEYGIVIGNMDILFNNQKNEVTIDPDAEKILVQIKKDGFTRLRLMEPFSRGYMKNFPDLPIQAIKLLTDRGFKVLLGLNGAPFINEGSDPKDKWVYRYFPGTDKVGKDDDGGLPEHKRRLAQFMDALKAQGLISNMQFQLFNEPNSDRYFWGTFEEWERLLAANIEVLTNPKYGIAKSDILCCDFTSNIMLNMLKDGESKAPYFNFIKSYKSNPLVNQFPFSFHWYPTHGNGQGAANYRTQDIKIKPIYEGAYITEMNETAFMKRDQLLGKGSNAGYRSRNNFKDKVEDVIAYAKNHHVKAIYFFNLRSKTDLPDERGRISTGLFNAEGCPRHEYKVLLGILNRPKNFGACGEPKMTDF